MRDIVTLLIGAAIGWCANWFFYRRSRADSAATAEAQLRHLRTLIEAAAAAGHIEPVRDSQGTVTGGRVIRPVVQTGAMAMEGQAPIVEVRAGPSTAHGAGVV